MEKIVKIIDPHCHLWDLSLQKHSWLTTEIEEGHLGDYSAICCNYLLDSYLHESKKYYIDGFVYIQSGWERIDTASEVKWMQRLINNAKKNSGIVGYVDLLSKNFQKILEEELSFSYFRGIRQIVNYDADTYYRGCSLDYLKCTEWRKNFTVLNQYKLCFDLQIYPEQVDTASILIEANKDVKFIIDHALMPKERSNDYYKFWKKQLLKLARYENVFIKISGFGMFEPAWNAHSIKPFVDAIIENFDMHKIMFASNFPVDKLYKTFDQIYDIYLNLIKDLSLLNQQMLIYKNAKEIYKL